MGFFDKVKDLLSGTKNAASHAAESAQDAVGGAVNAAQDVA